MIIEKMCEFIIMLELEKLSKQNDIFDNYMYQHDLNKFNNRYKELLDEFLIPYAMNKPEKSE